MSTLALPPFTFAVIGDSAAFGTGELDEYGNPRGWAWHLAQNFRDEGRYINRSRPGAQSAEVLNVQLPQVIETEPDICAVVAGGNDLLRNGFDPAQLYANLKETCHRLKLSGSEVVMFELHDPNQLLRLPRLLKRVLRRRVDSVNAVYRRLENELDIILIRTREIEDVHNIRNWHIDRMHPGPRGHQILAREIAEVLRRRGWNLHLPEVSDIVIRKNRENWIWLVRNGLPWFLKRSVDLLPAALILMTIESIRVFAECISRLHSRNS